MTSSRNDAILDAAERCVLAVGIRRTTLADVARWAGVSRPTVYRRWPDVRTLTADLLTRELVALLPAETGFDVDRIVGTVSRIRVHSLFVKILETDPELLTTYVFDRLGASQQRMLALLADAIRDAQNDGSVRAGDPDEIAAMLLLVAQSAVLSARTVAETLPPERLDAQLRALLVGYLRPEGVSHGCPEHR